MNGYQQKQRKRIVDPENIPRRQLTDWEKGFIDHLRKMKDHYELSPKENKKLNEMAKLFA